MSRNYRNRRVVVVALTVILAMAGSGPAAAQPLASQEQALAFRSPALPVLQQDIDALLAEIAPLHPVDWSLRVRPSVLYREYLEGKPDVSVTPRASVILQLRFSEKPVATVRRLLKLERAFAAHARAERNGVRSALLAHGELLLQQQATETAEASLADLRTAAGLSAGVQLQLDSATLAQRQAQHALGLAQADAQEHGLASEAVYASLRFRLPAATGLEPASTSAGRILELKVLEAEALLEQAGKLDFLSDLRIGTSYRTASADLDLEGGWLAGRPGLRLALTAPGGRERFEVRASVELIVDQKTSGLSNLKEGLADAQAELQRHPQQFEREAAAARAEAVFAEESLRLAEIAFSLAETERQQAQLSTRMWRAWLTYVRRTAELLELMEADWELR